MRRIASVFFPNWIEDIQKTGRYTLKNEREALDKLAKWAYRFSPLVAADVPTCTEPDERFSGINLDITGCGTLFGGEEKLVQELRRKLLQFGLDNRLAVAPTLGSAWGFSRYCEKGIYIVPEGTLREHLLPLPVEGLRISTKTVLALEETNLRRVGDLLLLPKHALASRFQPELVERLNQTLGLLEEPIVPVHFPQALKEELTFEGPVNDLEAIKKAAFLLLERLISVLQAAHKMPARIRVLLKRADAQKLEREIVLGYPSTDKKHLRSLLAVETEKFSTELSDTQAGIESVSLFILQTEDCRPYTLSSLPADSENDSKTDEANRYGKEFLDRLVTNLGTEQVLRVQSLESHIPERAFRFVPIKEASAEEKLKKFLSAAPLVQSARPSILFKKPLPITAMALLPDQPPFWVKWRNKKFRIQASLGPERISPEWWTESNPGTRDYFRVQLPVGTWLWIFRESTKGPGDGSNWFVHGVWA